MLTSCLQSECCCTCELSVAADFLELLGNVVFGERNEAKRVTVKLQRPTMPFADRVEVWSGVVIIRPAGNVQGKLLQGSHTIRPAETAFYHFKSRQSHWQGYTVIWTKVRLVAFLLSIHIHRFIARNSGIFISVSSQQEISVNTPHSCMRESEAFVEYKCPIIELFFNCSKIPLLYF